MLVQDTLTGQLHEVDGLGNPLGLAFLAPFAAKVLAAKALPLASRFLPKLLPHVRRFLPQVGQLLQRGINLAPRVPFQPQVPGPMPVPAMPMPVPNVPDASAMMPEPEPESEPTMGEMVYDGLGNPVGFVPSYGYRAPGVPGRTYTPGGIIVQRPGVTGPAVNPAMRWLPALQRMRAAMAQAQAQGQAPDPQLAARYQRMLQWYRRQMQGGGGGIPPGWMPRPTPYTGVAPRRLYLRCSTWRGPAGLVPASAAQAAQAVAAASAPAAAVAAAGRRHRRRR